MRFCKEHILILLLFWAGYLPAQTNNLWPATESSKSYRQSAYYFDETGNFKFIPQLTNAPLDTLKYVSTSFPNTASNWSGSIKFYSDRFDFFANGIRIGNSNVYIPEFDDNRNWRRIGLPIIAPCDTANFIFIRSMTSDLGIRYYHSFLGTDFISFYYIKSDSSHPTGYSIPLAASNKRIEYPNQRVLGCATTRNFNGQLILVVRTVNNLYSYEWSPENMDFKLLDSVNVPFLSLSSNPLFSDTTKFYIYRFAVSLGPALSSKGDKVAIPINYEVKTIMGGKVMEMVSAVLEFDFDRNTGKFTKLKPLYSHQWDVSQVQPPDPELLFPYYILYSPNGEFV